MLTSIWRRLRAAFCVATGRIILPDLAADAQALREQLTRRLTALKEFHMALADDINALIAAYETKLAAATAEPAALQAQITDLQNQLAAGEAVISAKMAALNPPAPEAATDTPVEQPAA